MDYTLFEVWPGNSVLLLPDAPTYTIVAVSNDFVRTSGFSREEAVGKGLFDLFRECVDSPYCTGKQKVSKAFQQVLHHKEPHHLPLQHEEVPNGEGTFSEKYWKASSVPVVSETGAVRYIIHTTEALTAPPAATQQQEDQLKHLEKAYHFFMQAPVAVCIVKGPDFIVELANEQMLQLLGRTPAMVGQRIDKSLTEAKVQGLMGILDRVRRTGQSHHTPNFPAELLIDGVREQRYFDLVFQPYYASAQDGVPSHIFCVAYNVTPQIRVQQQLAVLQSETQRQKRLYEAITGSTPDLIYVFDLQYRFTYANAALLTMWGKTSAEALGKGLLENGYEPWHAAMHEREIDQVAATKQPVRGEVSFPHATLGNRLYDYILVPVLNDKGAVDAVAGTTRDITEIKKAEEVLRQSQEKLEAIVAERTQELQRSNASLEEFAYAASHDMKEPIRKIHFFTDRLKSRLSDKLEAEDLRYFDRMEAAAQRMSTLIDDLLTYSQFSRGISHEETVDLNDTLQLVKEDMELIIEEKHAKVMAERLPTINGHRRQLQQLFENLIGNALKYSKPNVAPVIRLTTKLLKGRDTSLKLSGEEAHQRFHWIAVQDNGIGFEQKDADRIFHVFTRLHGLAEYKGTGVGLSIVRKVAENHRGYVWAESQPGAGATFVVLLPAE
jgi:PAS domain S-box-containing protein